MALSNCSSCPFANLHTYTVTHTLTDSDLLITFAAAAAAAAGASSVTVLIDVALSHRIVVGQKEERSPITMWLYPLLIRECRRRECERDGRKEGLGAGLGAEKVGQGGVKVMSGSNSTRGADHQEWRESEQIIRDESRNEKSKTTDAKEGENGRETQRGCESDRIMFTQIYLCADNKLPLARIRQTFHVFI